MKLPKACLFDFDGVVVDSYTSHYKAWKQAFFQLFNTEIPAFPSETHTGKSPMVNATYFAGYIGQVEKAKALYDLKGKLLHAATTPPDLLPGVREISSFLIQHKVPFGIASNATRAFVGNSVKQHNIPFEKYLGFENYTHPKPHPEPYLMLAEQLGIQKEERHEIWVFEDSLPGIKAVKSAGMQAIGIETQKPANQLLAAGCSDSFPSLLEAYHKLLSVTELI